VKQAKFDWFDILNYTFLILFCIVTLYPMVFVVAGSFNEGVDYLRGGVFFFPRSPTTANYGAILRDRRLITGYRVTILRAVIGTATHLLFTSMVAYGMSRQYLRFRNAYWWINLFTLFFNGGLIPIFMVLKTLGFINTFNVYITPLIYSVFNMIILHNFFRTIPDEVHESAMMDGASDFRIWIQLYLPLSKPVLATIALWTAVFHWNAFFDSMVFTSDPKLATLQLYLMKLIKESGAIPDPEGLIPAEVEIKFTAETIRLAAIVVSVVPILMIYPFLQRYFVKGIFLGSLKG
jgi:putative aldouronate transport system permease protein